VIVVDINDNANEVVRNVQQQNIGVHNNIANLVKNIMAQNGLNIGLHRPNFVSPLSELVLHLNFIRVIKFLSSPNLQGTLVSPLSNISQDI